jgi:phospholipase C
LKAGTAAAGMALLAGLPGVVSSGGVAAATAAATTPIKHLVVIYQENVSFDHYFGTYPFATNSSGQPFQATHLTPVNGLTPALLLNNPNGVNPKRLDPSKLSDVLTCDQGHNYNAEQKAFDGGKMDKFPSTVGNGGTGPTGNQCSTSDVMNYYDGNTTTALWNYAQHFSMSDNSFGTTFGPSSPGAINLVSGNTGTVGKTINGADTNGDTVTNGTDGRSLIEDAQPYYDDCSTRDAVSLTGTNIGDELNNAGLSWGWFQGGFRPSTSFATATAGSPQATSVFTPDEFSGKFNVAPATNQGLCNTVHPVGPALGGTGGTVPGGTNYGNKDDYIPHHEPFQYYASTANPHHLPVTSLAAIGTDTQTMASGVPQFDTANHQYDMSDFDALVAAINHGFISPDRLPAVSFLKAPGYQDGHALYSDPIDEQQFIAQEINALQKTPDWASTAVVIAYDDSDGWYDHAYSGVHNPSNTVNASPSPQDFLTGTGLCGKGTPLAGQNGRCGFGPRLPLLVISPYAKTAFVDHTLTTQTSMIRFVEDNWGLPRIPGSFDAVAGKLTNLFDFGHPQGNNKALFVDPTTGEPYSS